MKTRKYISILLILCMVVSTIILPVPITYALDNLTIFNYNNIEENDNLITDAEERSRYINYEAEIAAGHTQRIPTEETLSTIVYKNSDNSRTVYYFDENIKYVDSEGNIVEKDVTLESVNGGGYRTKQNDILTLLPNRISSGVTVAYKDNAVKLIPIVNDTVSGSFSMAADEIAHLNTSSNKVVYESVFGNYTDIAYMPTMRGFKEEIVLSQYKGINSWSFIAETNGMYAYCGNDGIYYFAECENADTQFSLGQVFVYDSSCGIAGGSMSVEPVIAGQKYCVTITADNSFLTDNSTVYPVYVDPQITITTAGDTANIIDATVYSGKPTLNTGTWTLNHVGLYNSDYGIGRMVVKLPGLISNEYYGRSDISIDNITYYVCEATGTGGQEIELYALNGSNWTETGVTWNNYGSLMGSKFTSATPGANAYGAFDITTLAKLWKAGVRDKDYGFVLVNKNETDAAKCRAFISNTHATTAKRPKVSLTYTITPRELYISPAYVDINVNGGTQLTATVRPSDAPDKSVTWSSSNTRVATVNANGYVTGIAPGTAYITCTTNVGGKTPMRDCDVTVNPISTSYTVMAKGTAYNITLASGRHYWFKFTPSVTGTYFFKTTGSTSTSGRLYQDTTQLAYKSDGGEGSNFKIAYRLIAGTQYRLCVYGSGGTCSLTVTDGWPEVSAPTIKSRSEWGASDKIESRLVERTRAPQRIIFHHSADKFSKTDEASVKAEIKRIQNLHMNSENKCDIAYHFIIDPAGRIWQGAEIDGYQRGHAAGYFDDIGVLILGDFEPRAVNLWSANTLNDQQKSAMETISKWLCYKYDLLIIGSGQNVAPISTHKTVDSGTVCPGANAAPWIEDTLRSIIDNWRK